MVEERSCARRRLVGRFGAKPWIPLAAVIGLFAIFDAQLALALDAADLCRTKPQSCTAGDLNSDAVSATSGRTITVPEVDAKIRSYFFATNREFDASELRKTVRDYGKLYLAERRGSNTEDQIRYGQLRISLPPNRATGTMPVPPVDSPRYVQTHIVIVHHDPIDSAPKFLRALSLASFPSVKIAPNGRFFLYLHGVNNTFEGAARRTAQLTADIEYSQPAVFFSWPSSSWSSIDPRSYLRDARELDFSMKYIREVFERLALLENASVDLVAHSRGGRAAIKLLEDHPARAAPKLDSLVLASADIDERDFVRDVVPVLHKLIPFTTLYISETDNALAAAELADGQKRVGQVAKFYSQHIDTIRVLGETPTSVINHFFYATSPRVLNDLQSVILHGKRASARMGFKGLTQNPDGYYDLEMDDERNLADKSLLNIKEFREHSRQAFEKLWEKLRRPAAAPEQKP